MLRKLNLYLLEPDVVPPYPPPTLKSLQGYHQQRGSYPQWIGRPLYSLMQCHPSKAGREGWRDSIESFIAEAKSNPSLPRVSILSTTVLANGESLVTVNSGAQDSWFQWLADYIVEQYGPLIGTRHPITGRVLAMRDLFALDWMHEMNIKGTEWGCHTQSTMPGATAINCANAARRVRDVMYARQPDLITDGPLWIWTPSQGGEFSSAIDSYPGDDYVDVIALDCYAGGLGGTNPPGGSYDNPTHHAQSWDSVRNTKSMSLANWFVPFAAGSSSLTSVQNINASTHPGDADQHGGRVGKKKLGFIEWGVIATDKTPSGGDGIIDGGTGDNVVFVNGILDFIEANVADFEFWIQFDINDGPARTAHKLSGPDSKWGYNGFPNSTAAFRSRVAGPE